MAVAAMAVVPAYPLLAEKSQFANHTADWEDWGGKVEFPRVGWLDRDLQKEARWLMAIRDRYPQCGMILRSHRQFRRDKGDETTWFVVGPVHERPQRAALRLVRGVNVWLDQARKLGLCGRREEDATAEALVGRALHQGGMVQL